MRVLAGMLGVSSAAAGLWLSACGIECAMADPVESALAALKVVPVVFWVWCSWSICLERFCVREDW